MNTDACSAWLVGGTLAATSGIHVIQGPGLYGGAPNGAWTRIGHNQATAFRLLRDKRRVVLSANHGLYAWERGEERWLQLHDETLTEILAVASTSGEPGLIAGCPYGVATAARDALGAARWTFHSDALGPDERYTNALLVDPNDESRWLAGSEAGVLVYSDSGAHADRSDLWDVPVRALYYTCDRFWAGAERGGLFSSDDGLHWERMGGKIEGAVYDINETDNRLVAATGHGIVAGNAEGPWQRLGPRMLFATLAVDGDNPQRWLAGASPGGLWHTEDGGQTWNQLDGFKHVRAVLPPEEKT